MKRLATGLILILFIFLLPPVSRGEEKPLNPGEIYDSSMELYYKGRCEEAIGGFSDIIRLSPTSKLVPYSRYMIGLCYLKMEKYKEALDQFELYLKNYPDGNRVREAERGVQISKERWKPFSTSEAKRVKRRICAQIFYLEGKNFEEAEKKVKQLKSSGIDTLIFRAFQNKGDRTYKFAHPRHEEGVYFKTTFAPVVDDLLGRMTEIAHRNGLDIFAWMPTRYVTYLLDGRPEYRCKSYNFETKRIEIGRGLNLFHPDVLRRLEGLFRDLGRYPIDGILFQDDLVLRHNEDFSPEANKLFLKEFGYAPHPDIFYVDPYRSNSGKYYVKAYTDQFWSWANWKNRYLMNVAKRLMGTARELNPNLNFAINLYFETILNHSSAMAWFSQTLSGAIEKSFDYYAVMAYHRQTMKELGMEEVQAIDLMAEVAQKAVSLVGDPSKVLMKVQILDWKSYEVIPKKEVEELLAQMMIHGNVSLAFVPYIEQFPLQQLKGQWAPAQ